MPLSFSTVWTPVNLLASAVEKTVGMDNQAKLTEPQERRKRGRPRLGDCPDFYERLYEVLPALRDGGMSKGEAARQLGISHRSLNRYLEQP